MSFSNLKIIPRNPQQRIPDIDDHILIGKLKSVFPNSDNVEINKYDRIHFIVQGNSFDSVTCNLCKQSISLSWWQNAFSKAEENQFENLECECPNCFRMTNLNELNYKFPAGFARFSINILNPKLTEGLQAEKIRDFYSMLNCELRQIWTCN